MKILITGACGFVGQHLTEELLQGNHEVVMGVRTKEYIGFSRVEKIILDITDTENIKAVLTTVMPDAVVHLAAQSKVGCAWENPTCTFGINTLGTIELVKQISEITPTIKILTIGSSEEYGQSAKNYELLNELVPCFPQNPYASSKLAAGEVALQLARKNKLNLIHVRPFNHFGPGQDRGFVISDFASQIASIELGYQEPVLKVGDLSAQRDFTDVRDIAVAYRLLLEQEVESGIYNIGSGLAYRISDILNILLSHSQHKISVEVDYNKYRPAEVSKFAGDSTKVRSAVGWEPAKELEDSLKDTLNWWRVKMGRSKEDI
jgi:GDP-4-dehydro-6-deoxy-D-mannose reductase